MDRALYVAVVGSGDASDALYEQAREVGRLFAERGGVVVCGGLSGVMEAVARGAKEASGTAIGDLPEEDLWNAFCAAPTAKATHHARLGGLLEHSIYCSR